MFTAYRHFIVELLILGNRILISAASSMYEYLLRGFTSVLVVGNIITVIDLMLLQLHLQSINFYPKILLHELVLTSCSLCLTFFPSSGHLYSVCAL